MPISVEALNAYAAEWTTLVVAVVWQSTLVVLIVAAIAQMLRRASPAVRYWLWQIAAIKLLVMPLWTFSLPMTLLPTTLLPTTLLPAALWGTLSPAEAEPAAIVDGGQQLPLVDANEVASVAPQVPSDDRPLLETISAPSILHQIDLRAWLLLAWLGVLAFEIGQLVWQHRRLKRLLQSCRSADGPLKEQVAEAAAKLGLKQTPEALITDAAYSPFVCGMRPKIVLSQQVLDDVSPEQLAAVLVHELAHLKRRDLLWGWIPEIVARLYFFHPIVYWISYRVRLERELACDQIALQHSGRTPAEYADTLVRVVSAAAGTNVIPAAGMDGRKR